MSYQLRYEETKRQIIPTEPIRGNLTLIVEQEDLLYHRLLYSLRPGDTVTFDKVAHFIMTKPVKMIEDFYGKRIAEWQFELIYPLGEVKYIPLWIYEELS